nr:MAG TPA: hypothetical protein [Caudoviricetes sp.]
MERLEALDRYVVSQLVALLIWLLVQIFRKD